MSTMNRRYSLVVYSALTLLLAACGGGSVGGTPPSPDDQSIVTSRLNGTVSDDALFGGSVLLVDSVDTPQSAPIALSNVGSQGEITLPLTAKPNEAESFPAIPSMGGACQFTGTASSPATTVALYSGLLAYGAQDDLLATVQETVIGGEGATVGRLYASDADTIRGVVHCPDGYILDYNVALTEGWNAVELSGNATTLNIHNLSASARSSLSVTRLDKSVYISLDDKSTVQLNPGERITRSATIFQIGAYSGTVKLGTNVPGITIEPSTVTLAKLGTQALRSTWKLDRVGMTPLGLSRQGKGIGALSLSTPLTFVAAADAMYNMASTADQLIVLDADQKVVGTTSLAFQVNAPYVEVQIPTGMHLNLNQGESIDVPLTAYGQRFYSGTVDISLGNLPVGVTATPTPVHVDPSSFDVHFTVHVTASKEAPLGDIQATVTGKRVKTTAVLASQVGLSILPYRASLPQWPVSIEPSLSGVWILSSTPGNHPSVTAYDGTAATSVHEFIDLPSMQSALLPSANGDAYLYTNEIIDFYEYHGLIRLSKSGVISQMKFQTAAVGNNLSDGVVDDNGNVWFMNDWLHNDVLPATSSAGSLSKINNQGVIDFNDKTRPYVGFEKPVLQDSGQRVFVPPYSSRGSNDIAVVNTFDNSISDIGHTLMYEPGGGVVSAAGIYYVLEYNKIASLGLDGTRVDFAIDASSGMQMYSLRLIGFDRSDKNVLWMVDNDSVAKYHVDTGKIERQAMVGVDKASIGGTKGVWVTTYVDQHSYLSHLE